MNVVPAVLGPAEIQNRLFLIGPKDWYATALQAFKCQYAESPLVLIYGSTRTSNAQHYFTCLKVYNQRLRKILLDCLDYRVDFHLLSASICVGLWSAHHL